MFCILIGILISTSLYLFVKRSLTYWKNKNVPQKPVLEVFQQLVSTLTRRKPFCQTLCNVYNEFPDKRYNGIYGFLLPSLLLRDIELIKQITVKEFDHFTDHRSLIPSDIEPLWNDNLFSLKGEKWRHMRATLSPSFTSSKMKAMFVLMSQCAEDFVKFFTNNKDDSKVIDVDMTDVSTRFANDVIATTAFGIKCDSLKDRENEFYLMGKEATGVFRGTWATIRFTIFVAAPKIAKLFEMQLFSEKVGNFFLNLISNTIKTREENNIVRPDMIHLLMEARKGKHTDISTNLPDAGFATVEEHIEAKNPNYVAKLTDMDITAQALIFFFAGFDTVSRSLCFIAQELATNPDIQERLRQEVDETLAECNGKLTYEALMKMKYLDMVISEGLRLWPNGVMLDRECVKPFTIKPVSSDELPVMLDVGDTCWIPVFAIHRDPQHYPDPERFDPERFNDENKANIKPYTYLPFGVGPRSCIGSRFALLEIKILLFHILCKFELVPTEKTSIPITLAKEFNLYSENGFHLGFKRRTNVLAA